MCGPLGYIGKELAGVDKVALGLDGIIFDVVGNHLVGHRGSLRCIASPNITGEVFADKAIKIGCPAQTVSVPPIYCSTHLVGNRPSHGALLSALLVISL